MNGDRNNSFGHSAGDGSFVTPPDSPGFYYGNNNPMLSGQRGMPQQQQQPQPPPPHQQQPDPQSPNSYNIAPGSSSIFIFTPGQMHTRPMLSGQRGMPQQQQQPQAPPPHQQQPDPQSPNSYNIASGSSSIFRFTPGQMHNAITSPALARALSTLSADKNRRPRSEKKPIPDDQKDDKYFERRRRNNEAAKKSRDSRKQREDELAIRASFLEKDNSVLKVQVMSMREEAMKLRQMWFQKCQTNGNGRHVLPPQARTS